MKLRGWMFLLPLPLTAIMLMIVVLSRWGGWVVTQLCVSTFGTMVLLQDPHQAPGSLALALTAIWGTATANTGLYLWHTARRLRTSSHRATPTAPSSAEQPSDLVR